MLVFPNIKINLGLSITSRREDGYHNIESVFYPVPWEDSLEIIDRSSAYAIADVKSDITKGKVRMATYGFNIPGDPSENLCIKVYELLEEWFNLPPVDIHLLKNIPIGAGLGGGSADAAYCLKALKTFFNLRISDVEATELLSKLGSDCPFFWKNQPQFVYGTGIRMRPIDIDLSGYFIVLVYPNLAISTKEAYAGVIPRNPTLDLNLLPSLDVEGWQGLVVNDFEHSLFPSYPILGEIKTQLIAMGASYASMSGSGSTVFGLFKDEPSLPEEFETFTTFSTQLPMLT